MKVSLISGLYNCEKHIGRCLDSILAQTYKDIEIILINNGSSDNTGNIVREYLEKYPDNIIYYETNEKLGAGGSRQKGVELSNGEYFCIIDCDDYISNDYVDNMVKSAIENGYPDIIYCSFCKITSEGKVMYKRTFREEQEALIQGVAPWAKMFKRSYVNKNDLFFRNIPWGEDVIFNTELINTNPNVCIANSCGTYYWVYRLDSTSHTEIKNFPSNAIEKAIEYFDYMYSKYSREQLKYLMIKYFIWYLLQSGMNVKPSKIINEYIKAFNYVESKYPIWWKGKIEYPVFERKAVLLAVKGFRLLRTIRCERLFLRFYCKLPMEKLWPSL